jgi:hypothetical protein
VDTPARLTALRAAGSVDGFAYPDPYLKSFGVVNAENVIRHTSKGHHEVLILNKEVVY